MKSVRLLVPLNGSADATAATGYRARAFHYSEYPTVLGDLSARRGHILGTEPEAENSKRTRVRAIVPLADMHLYATKLSSLTHGRGLFTQRFHGYEHMPHDHAQKVIDHSSRGRQEELAQ